MRGRKPKPTALKLANGTHKSRINDKEPKATGKAKPPSYLDVVARREWRRIAPILERMGVLTEADATALGLYCQAYSDYLDALDELKEDKVVTTAAGGLKPSPFLQIAKDAKAEMIRLLVEFGCTPSSRSRIVATSQGVDDLAAFLK